MKSILFCLFVSFVFCLQARQPFHATVTVDSESAKVSDPTVSSLIHDLKTQAIEQLIPIYTPTSPVSININFRGIHMLTAFAANSTTLTLDIPQLGITQTFTGGTRDESVALLENYLKNNANNNKKLFKAYARYSPIDPVAGNPFSLMSSMAQSDYTYSSLSPLSGCNCCWSAQPILHQFQAGLNVGRGLTHGYETTAVSLPLRYSYSPDRAHAFIIDAPLTLLKNDGAYSLFGSLGLGFRFPILCGWSLTPAIRLGYAGSIDLDTAGTFFSAGLVSNINIPTRDYVFSVINQATYYTSTPFHLGSINCDYHLYNFVFKNGFAITSCRGISICQREVRCKLTFTDTFFEGADFFINHYDEVGLNLITTHINPCIEYDCLSIGFSVQYGKKNFRGYLLNTVYQF